MLWAAAIRSTRPPARSPCIAISLAPPMAPPKNAVGLDTFAKRRSAHDSPKPSIIDQTTPSRIQGQHSSTRSTTAGEK